MESLFDVIYLITVITLGVLTLKGSKGDKQFRLFGIMAIVLGLGDAFHLVPRVTAYMTTGLADYTQALGFGIFALAIVRIALCLMPQNEWMTANPPIIWGIYRNIPFALLGLLIIVLFYCSAKENNDKAFKWMWLTIVLSFGFYIPVTLWAEAIPMIGMLMIPKTCAYVWAVIIGYNAMKKECKVVH